MAEAGAEPLAEVLARLLVPDNEVVTAATLAFNERARRPGSYGCIPDLVQILQTHPHPGLRQMAGVLLRRRIGRQWSRVPAAGHQTIKQTLMNVLIHDPSAVVKQAAAGVISTIARFELPSGQWPELLDTLFNCCMRGSPEQRDAGMSVFSCIMETAADILRPHMQQLLELFGHTLRDPQLTTCVHSITAMVWVVSHVRKAQAPIFRELLPHVYAAIRRCIKEDETLISDALDLFEELSNRPPRMFGGHFAAFMGLMLDLGCNAELAQHVRVKAYDLISTYAVYKSKLIVKSKVIEPVLQSCFRIMTMPLDESAEPDEQSLNDYVVEVIDALATHLPSEIVFPIASHIIGPSATSPDPCLRAAAIKMLYAAIEGCSYYIVNEELLPSILRLVYQALGDADEAVREAANLALAKLARRCQPDICEYNGEVLPRLLAASDNSSADVREYACYALETLLENLGDKVIPYLPDLMSRWMAMAAMGDDIHCVAISSIGITAKAARELFAPYYASVFEHLVQLLQIRTAERLPLMIQATDTLGCLISSANPATVEPVIADCMRMGFQIIAEVDDADARVAVYSLFGSVALVMRERFAVYMEPIVTQLLQRVESEESLQLHREAEAAYLLNDGGGDDDEEEDDGEVLGFSVSTPLLMEQESALTALGWLVEHTGIAFAPYYQRLSDTCFKLQRRQQFAHHLIRKAVLFVFSRLCVTLPDIGVPLEVQQQAMTAILGAWLSTLNREEEVRVAVEGVEGLEWMLAKLGNVQLFNDQLIGGMLQYCEQILRRTAPCSTDAGGDEEVEGDTGDGYAGEETEEGDVPEAELQGLLIEDAADVVATTAKCMGPAFLPYFASFLPMLVQSAKPSCLEWERSMAIGTLAELIGAVGPSIAPHVETVLAVLLRCHTDESGEVRSNAAFAVGVLCEKGGACVHRAYPQILQSLYQHCFQPANTDMMRAKDNAVSAVARMIVAHPAGVPLDHVLPALFRALPLQEDFGEALPVVACCIFLLAQLPPATLAPFVGTMVSTLISTFRAIPEPAADLIAQSRALLERLRAVYADDMARVWACLSEDQRATLQPLL